MSGTWLCGRSCAPRASPCCSSRSRSVSIRARDQPGLDVGFGGTTATIVPADLAPRRPRASLRSSSWSRRGVPRSTWLATRVRLRASALLVLATGAANGAVAFVSGAKLVELAALGLGTFALVRSRQHSRRSSTCCSSSRSSPTSSGIVLLRAWRGRPAGVVSRRARLRCAGDAAAALRALARLRRARRGSGRRSRSSPGASAASSAPRSRACSASTSAPPRWSRSPRCAGASTCAPLLVTAATLAVVTAGTLDDPLGRPRLPPVVVRQAGVASGPVRVELEPAADLRVHRRARLPRPPAARHRLVRRAAAADLRAVSARPRTGASATSRRATSRQPAASFIPQQTFDQVLYELGVAGRRRAARVARRGSDASCCAPRDTGRGAARRAARGVARRARSGRSPAKAFRRHAAGGDVLARRRARARGRRGAGRAE